MPRDRHLHPSAGNPQAVAHPRFIDEVLGLRRFGLDLVAKLLHVNAQVSHLILVRGPPDLPEDLATADHPARRTDHHRNKPILRRSKVHLHAANGDATKIEVYAEITYCDDPRVGRLVY